jgi:hypothetical protein
MNNIEYFVNTREEYITTKDLQLRDSQTSISISRQRGRPRHNRYFYQESHPSSDRLLRVARSETHNILPNFIGVPFPIKDDPDRKDYFYACMLMLLKPWRKLDDLMENFGSWGDAYNMWYISTTIQNKRIISNIQHFHRCKSAVDRDRQTKIINPTEQQDMDHGESIVDDTMDNDINLSQLAEDDIISQQDWDRLNVKRVNPHQQLYAKEAVRCGEFSGLFRSTPFVLNKTDSHPHPASPSDMIQLQVWKHMLTQTLSTTMSNEAPGNAVIGDLGSVLHSDYAMNMDYGVNQACHITLLENEPNIALNPIQLGSLNAEQRRAYEIIKYIIDSDDRNPPQLLMLLHGEGGTGKSRVIQTITDLFKQRGILHKLIKVAYTGVAASLIEGETIHKSTKIRINGGGGKLPVRTIKELEVKWQDKSLLIIDEDSMISKAFLAKMSRNIRLGRNRCLNNDRPFGGLNVLMCGDFHQFPPVASSKYAPLYMPWHGKDSTLGSNAIEGRRIYEQFDHCVLLTQQMRVKDSIWHSFLQRLRCGIVTSNDIDLLRSLILKPGEFNNCNREWRYAKLVTPRHVVRKAWNKRVLEQHVRDTGHQIFKWNSYQTINGRELSDTEK